MGGGWGGGWGSGGRGGGVGLPWCHGVYSMYIGIHTLLEPTGGFIDTLSENVLDFNRKSMKGKGEEFSTEWF